jgi:hypothetical protein
VWSSSDGRKWILEVKHAGFSPRGEMGLVVFHDRLWVIAGGNYLHFGYSNITDDVWSSKDGKQWSQETEHAGFGPRFGYGVVVYKDKLWIVDGQSEIDTSMRGMQAGGTRTGGSQDVWSSDDGAHWNMVKDEQPFSGREFAPVVVFDDKLWLVGGGYLMLHLGIPDIPSYENNVWISSDGSNWTLQNGDPGVHLGFGPVIVFKDAIWYIGNDIIAMNPQPYAIQKDTANSSRVSQSPQDLRVTTTQPRDISTIPITTQERNLTQSAPLPNNSSSPTYDMTPKAGIDGPLAFLNILEAIMLFVWMRGGKRLKY